MTVQGGELTIVSFFTRIVNSILVTYNTYLNIQLCIFKNVYGRIWLIHILYYSNKKTSKALTVTSTWKILEIDACVNSVQVSDCYGMSLD